MSTSTNMLADPRLTTLREKRVRANELHLTADRACAEAVRHYADMMRANREGTLELARKALDRYTEAQRVYLDASRELHRMLMEALK